MPQGGGISDCRCGEFLIAGNSLRNTELRLHDASQFRQVYLTGEKLMVSEQMPD